MLSRLPATEEVRLVLVFACPVALVTSAMRTVTTSFTARALRSTKNMLRPFSPENSEPSQRDPHCLLVNHLGPDFTIRRSILDAYGISGLPCFERFSGSTHFDQRRL